jgi:hypothetical protein
MSEADKLFDQLQKMPLQNLLALCSNAIDTKLEQKRLDTILLLLETRLQKYRMLRSFDMDTTEA